MTTRAFRLLLILILLPLAPRVRAGVDPEDDPEARQVTLFGVIATPDDPRIDPKLTKIAPQLRKLLPDHGFRLLSVKTRRLAVGRTLTVPLGEGLTAATTLNEAVDANGKVKLRCEVLRGPNILLESVVTTPANQLFFCDKVLPDGSRLLVGIGAR